MKVKVLWIIIIALIVSNCLLFAFFLSSNGERKVLTNSLLLSSDVIENETVAIIGDETINREQWLQELESRYGKQTLEGMVNEKVIRSMAKKYDIKANDEVIDREITMIKAMYNSSDHEVIDEKLYRKEIELNILLEKLLTKDVEIPDEDLERFYEDNKELYEIPATYHISQILVKTSDEAKQVVNELKNGSDFSTLAMEKSKDEFSASLGGSIGYVSVESEHVPQIYLDTVKQLEVDEYSEPIQVDGGFVILRLNEKIEKITYTFKEVKDQIARQIALDQMSGSASVRSLWKEMDVSWFYGKNEN